MIRLGILSPSEIAYRRFMPALKQLSSDLEFVAIAIASPEEWFGDCSAIAKDIINNL